MGTHLTRQRLVAAGKLGFKLRRYAHKYGLVCDCLIYCIELHLLVSRSQTVPLVIEYTKYAICHIDDFASKLLPVRLQSCGRQEFE